MWFEDDFEAAAASGQVYSFEHVVQWQDVTDDGFQRQGLGLDQVQGFLHGVPHEERAEDLEFLGGDVDGGKPRGDGGIEAEDHDPGLVCRHFNRQVQLGSHGFEDECGATAVGRLPDCLCRVGFPRVDDQVCADFLCDVRAVRGGFDDDDLSCALVFQCCHGEQADGSAADNDCGLTGVDAGFPQSVQDAAQWLREDDLFGRDVGIHPVGVVCGDADVFGHAAVPPLARRAWPAGNRAFGVVVEGFAEVGVAGTAGVAPPAGRILVNRDCVAHGQGPDGVSDGHDFSAELVAEDHSGFGGVGRRNVKDVQIGPADPDRSDFEDDVVRLEGRGHGALFEFKDPVSFEYGGEHGVTHERRVSFLLVGRARW